jgi:L-fuculose-phosphate aldolase
MRLDSPGIVGARFIDLSPSQELAILARSLQLHGYDDHTFGHISYRQPDDSILMTPYELGWDEIRASDIVRLDLDGTKIEGDYSVTPAVVLHLALHRARPDITVGVHNHPRWGTVWSALGRIPPAYDQLAATIHEDHIGVLDEYVGAVNDESAADANVRALADRDMLFLGNHGVFVVGENIEIAHHRAVALEHRCHIAWEVEQLGGGRPMPSAFVRELSELNKRRSGHPHMFPYMARKALRLDPQILD